MYSKTWPGCVTAKASTLRPALQSAQTIASALLFIHLFSTWEWSSQTFLQRSSKFTTAKKTLSVCVHVRSHRFDLTYFLVIPVYKKNEFSLSQQQRTVIKSMLYIRVILYVIKYKTKPLQTQVWAPMMYFRVPTGRWYELFIGDPYFIQPTYYSQCFFFFKSIRNKII